MFSKKATKIDEIFTDDLTLTTKCQSDGEDLINNRVNNRSINLFLTEKNCGLIRKH